MKVKIHLNEQSKPIKRKKVINTYTKGGMFCVMLKDKVEKYPLVSIFRVEEN